jgi:predicted Zn-dependent peptidase
MPLIERYFGQLPSRPAPEPVRTQEPPQTAERQISMREMAQPLFLEGYHRPDYRDLDDVVYDAITDLMSNGRTSRLYRALVRDKKIAADAEGFSGFPGIKYPSLFAFYAIPTPGHTTTELRDAIHEEIEKIRTQDISDEELKMIKTRAKAALIRSLGDNEGLAEGLATYQARYGDWRELFHQVDKIDKVSKADIRRVANKIFIPENRTVGILDTRKPAGKGGQQ